MVVRSVGTSTCLYAGLEERRGKHHPKRPDYLRVGALRIVQLSVCREKSHLEIVVQNQLLPYPKDWKYRLDLWQNPWAVAWYNHVEPWSPEHKMLLKQHLKHYADAGGTYITTYGVHSPWSDNSYMIEGGMIEWIKKAAVSYTHLTLPTSDLV